MAAELRPMRPILFFDDVNLKETEVVVQMMVVYDLDGWKDDLD